MSEIPADLRYTEEHEWVRVDGDELVVGITDHAQSELGELVFIEPPEVGATIAAGTEIGELESHKGVSDLFAPLDGEVTAVNEALVEAPEQLNGDPYGVGWLLRMRPSDPSAVDGLLDADGYRAHIS